MAGHPGDGRAPSCAGGSQGSGLRPSLRWDGLNACQIDLPAVRGYGRVAFPLTGRRFPLADVLCLASGTRLFRPPKGGKAKGGRHTRSVTPQPFREAALMVNITMPIPRSWPRGEVRGLHPGGGVLVSRAPGKGREGDAKNGRGWERGSRAPGRSANNGRWDMDVGGGDPAGPVEREEEARWAWRTRNSGTSSWSATRRA